MYIYIYIYIHIHTYYICIIYETNNYFSTAEAQYNSHMIVYTVLMKSQKNFQVLLEPKRQI